MSTQYSERQRASLAAIRNGLLDSTLAYPSVSVTDDQLVGMTALWAEDLMATPAATITEAFRRHRKTARFFPSLADIVTLCGVVEEEQREERSRVALEQPKRTPEEQCEINRRGLEKVLGRLRGCFSAPREAGERTRRDCAV